MPTGWVDEIHDDGMISGWAFDGPRPAKLLLKYSGQVRAKFIADEFRSDLKAAGIGNGRHGFRVPLPCHVDDFALDKMSIHFRDGSSLRVGPFFEHWNKVDLLLSDTTRSVNIEFTSRCNLRCVYCLVSQPTYEGQDWQFDDIEEFIRQLKARRVTMVTVNGHGETTYVPGWEKWIYRLADEGFRLSIITNMARLLRPDELSAMARVSYITVSVDTHNPELLSRIRRRVKLENILNNMQNVRETAERLGLPRPKFIWNCVLSDKVAGSIKDYFNFGMSLGVLDYFICNLVEYDDIPGAEKVRHVSTIGASRLASLASDLRDARRLLEDGGGSLNIAGDLAEMVGMKVIR